MKMSKQLVCVFFVDGCSVPYLKFLVKWVVFLRSDHNHRDKVS